MRDILLRPGIGGGTSVSMQRRAHDRRFATRYFVGHGIDIGAGDDSLMLFTELFPLIKGLARYDVEEGDAQTLANVNDNDWDFVYSSHCLEHMAYPHAALNNWIRICKPGGYLIITVPDEDLYEQGKWPSDFSPDHKWTFTLCKANSWSPASINVFAMLEQFCDLIRPLSVSTIDHCYRYQLPRFDQTKTPLTEAAIEIIARKL